MIADTGEYLVIKFYFSPEHLLKSRYYQFMLPLRQIHYEKKERTFRL